MHMKMAKDGEITPERAKLALVVQVQIDSRTLSDCLHWGSWTVAAELAAKIASTAQAIRVLELIPEGLGQQEMTDLLVRPKDQCEFIDFGSVAPAIVAQPERAANG